MSRHPLEILTDLSRIPTESVVIGTDVLRWTLDHIDQLERQVQGLKPTLRVVPNPKPSGPGGAA